MIMCLLSKILFAHFKQNSHMSKFTLCMQICPCVRGFSPRIAVIISDAFCFSFVVLRSRKKAVYVATCGKGSTPCVNREASK